MGSRALERHLGTWAIRHLGTQGTQDTQGTLFSRLKKNICYRNLTDLEKTFISNWRELEAIRFSLLSSIKQFENRCIFWNTDNFATQQIIKCGVNKTHIHSLALNIFNLTFDHNIHLKVFWVGREYNKEADKISKTIDFDHWYTTLRLTNILEQRWGKISIHRFSSDINRKSERFSPTYLCPETEGINAFLFDWSNEVNLLVPTAHLIPRAIKQFLKSLTKSKAILKNLMELFESLPHVLAHRRENNTNKLYINYYIEWQKWAKQIKLMLRQQKRYICCFIHVESYSK